MTDIGHNNPPEVLELASGVISDVSSWMADNPVIETEEDARGMKLQVDRTKLCVKDLEFERRSKTDPLNSQIETIMARYRGPRRMLGDLLDEMLARLDVFVKAEEKRRAEVAAEAIRKAREAEAAAREAERVEKEKLDDAAKGEVGIDVAKVIQKADQAFESYEKAEREAIRAEREVHVKVGGGLSRAIGLREKETLTVTDHLLALKEIGFTKDIEDAVLKAARAYRKLHGHLPRGISSTVEKSL